MKQKNKKLMLRNPFKLALCILLCITILLGSLIRISNFRIFGIVITLQRVMIPIFFIIIVAMSLNNKFKITMKKIELQLWSLFFIWLFYGLVLILINSNLNIRDSLQELLTIPLNFMAIYCIYIFCMEKGNLETIFIIIKCIAVCFILFAIFELITGRHLATSAYRLDLSWSESKIVYATAIFYNPNDFSTALALLSVFFIPDEEVNKKALFFDFTCLILIFFINLINDANIVIVAMFAGASAYIIIKKIYKRRNFIYFFIAGIIGIVFIFLFKVLLEGILYTGGVIGLRESRLSLSNLINAFSIQISNYSRGYGSLFDRITIYKESLKVVADGNILGLGPASFSLYFSKNPSASGLVNPHNLWLEILVQYGILVFTLYVFLLMKVYKKMKQAYKREQKYSLNIMIMMVIYCIACISPSNFLESQYQWLPLMLGMGVIADFYRNKETNPSCASCGKK